MTVVSIKCVTLVDGVTFELPFADLLPDLAPSLYAELRESIKAEGILTPILVNEHNEVIDGQHRLLIAKELGMPSSQIHQQLTLPDDGSPRADILARMKRLAIISNIHRRQLSPDTRAEFVAVLKGEGLSNREIARTIGVAEGTVRNDLAKCSGAQNYAPEHPEKATGADGKTYPVKVAPETIPERRQRVAEAKAEGKSHREIAEEVGVSVGTVVADLKAVPDDEPEETAEHRDETDSEDFEAAAAAAVDRLRDRVRKSREPETEEIPICDDCGFSVPASEKPSNHVEKPESEDAEFVGDLVDRHLARAKRLYGPESDQAEPEPRPLSKWEQEKLAKEEALASIKLKLVKLDPDRWKVVKEEDDQLVGLISRGGPDQADTYGFTAYLVIDETREEQLLPSYGERFETLKAVKRNVQEYLLEPDEFLRGLNRSKEYRSGFDSKPKIKFPAGQVNDLPLEDGRWKVEHDDLKTGSLWIFGPRAKGPGRDGSYHGNFIPQIPDQVLRKHTHADDLVLDMFLGSGTSMVEALALKRNFIGVDIQPAMVKAAEKAVKKLPNPGKASVKLLCGDSSGALVSHQIREYLDGIGRDSVDHVFLHPPYWDIVQFTEGEDENDLSAAKSLEQFLRKFQKVAWRSIELLAPGGFLTLVIGDIAKGPELIPLGFRCMQVVQQVGQVVLKQINPKDIQGNNKAKDNPGVQEYRALRNGTSLFKHEYVMIFRKGLE